MLYDRGSHLCQLKVLSTAFVVVTSAAANRSARQAVGVTCVHPPSRQRFRPADYLPQARRSPKPLRERAMPSIPEQQQSNAPSDGAGTKEAAGAAAASSSAGFAAVDSAQPSFGASERAGLGPAEHGSSAGGLVPCTASLTASARSTLCIVSAVLRVHCSGEQHVTAVQQFAGHLHDDGKEKRSHSHANKALAVLRQVGPCLASLHLWQTMILSGSSM